MRYPTVFNLISEVIKEANVFCVLIGGFAVNYYNYARQTRDIDFLITEEDFRKILPLFEKEGYKEERKEKLFSKLVGSRLYPMSIDFLFIDKETLTDIIKNGKQVEIAEQNFIIPSLYDLIALKLHAIKYNPKFRELIDLLDIVSLIQINKVDVKSGAFKKLCCRYGTEELYSKIINFVK